MLVKIRIIIILSIIRNYGFLLRGVVVSLVFVLMPVSTQSVDETKNMSIVKKIRSFEYTQKWQVLYLKSIEYIKKHEGFSSVPYLCAAGKPTIGYGHVISDAGKTPGLISRTQAEYILRKDFDQAIKLAEKAVPGIDGARKLAVAHFVFSLGIGRFLRSDLRKVILQNDTSKLDSVWLMYCNYTAPDGKKIRSEYAYNMRKWELELFKN